MPLRSPFKPRLATIEESPEGDSVGESNRLTDQAGKIFTPTMYDVGGQSRGENSSVSDRLSVESEGSGVSGRKSISKSIGEGGGREVVSDSQRHLPLQENYEQRQWLAEIDEYVSTYDREITRKTQEIETIQRIIKEAKLNYNEAYKKAVKDAVTALNESKESRSSDYDKDVAYALNKISRSRAPNFERYMEDVYYAVTVIDESKEPHSSDYEEDVYCAIENIVKSKKLYSQKLRKDVIAANKKINKLKKDLDELLRFNPSV